MGEVRRKRSTHCWLGSGGNWSRSRWCRDFAWRVRMRFALQLRAVALILGLSTSLGETVPNSSQESIAETEEHKWELSLSTATYFVQDGRDFVNPTITADRNWLHLEARYNYESLNTGSF